MNIIPNQRAAANLPTDYAPPLTDREVIFRHFAGKKELDNQVALADTLADVIAYACIAIIAAFTFGVSL